MGSSQRLPGLHLGTPILGLLTGGGDAPLNADSRWVTASLAGVVRMRVMASWPASLGENMGNQPSARRPMRRRATSGGIGCADLPAPIQMGMGRCTGRGFKPAWLI